MDLVGTLFTPDAVDVVLHTILLYVSGFVTGSKSFSKFDMSENPASNSLLETFAHFQDLMAEDHNKREVVIFLSLDETIAQ